MAMIDLDNTKKLLESQGDSVISSIDSIPLQLSDSFHQALQIEIPADYSKINKIVVSGMGGSRFPSKIIRNLFKKEIKVPYIVNDDYRIPGFVDDKTLFILSSYSGTTEEVVYCGKEALNRGAKLLGITTGGEVATFLVKNNCPMYLFNPIHNRSGQPRIGFGYLVGGHLALLLKTGFLPVKKALIETAIGHLPRLIAAYKIEVPIEHNIAKQTAIKLYEKFPYYIVSEFLLGVGNAIANQTNETAKTISSFRVIPELNHHLMEGLKFPEKLRSIDSFVFFFSKLYSPQIQKRFAITKEVVEKNGIDTLWIEMKGSNEIEQVFELMTFGSYLSMYLAALYEQNPIFIPYVDYFKKRLKEMK